MMIYIGALSAWFRAKYPDLIVGAVGSSGPVQAEVNFVEYFEVVQQSLATYRLLLDFLWFTVVDY